MAFLGAPETRPSERDHLEDLKRQLERRQKDVERLTAAIMFLEANPGAVALITSL